MRKSLSDYLRLNSEKKDNFTKEFHSAQLTKFWSIVIRGVNQKVSGEDGVSSGIKEHPIISYMWQASAKIFRNHKTIKFSHSFIDFILNHSHDRRIPAFVNLNRWFSLRTLVKVWIWSQKLKNLKNVSLFLIDF